MEQIFLSQLDPAAGAELLADAKVLGSREELQQASIDFGAAGVHPQQTQGGGVNLHDASSHSTTSIGETTFTRARANTATMMATKRKGQKSFVAGHRRRRRR